MADIPICLTDLKRPELQALSKKYKIRANMKNLEMISALNEEREKFLSCCENESTSQEPNETSDEREEEAMEHSPAKENKEQAATEEEMEISGSEKNLPKDSPQKPAPDPVNTIVPCDSTADSYNPPSDELKDTSVNVDSNDNISSTTTFTSCKDVEIQIKVSSSTTVTDTRQSLSLSEMKQEQNGGNISVNLEFDTNPNSSINIRKISVSPPYKDPVKEKMDSEEPIDTSPLPDMPSINNMAPLAPSPDSDLKNNKIVLQDPIPDPISNNDDDNNSEKSSKHNDTFTIETPEKDIVMPYPGLTAFKESLNLTPIQKPSTPLRGVWALRESENTPSFLVDSDSPQGADEVCTKEKDEGETKEKDEGEKDEGEGAGCMSEAVGECHPLTITHGVSEEKENKDYYGEIMNLLEKRVEETKSRPDYVPPPPTKIPISTSRIPQTKIGRKFDAAHRKEFSKMKSITDTEIRCKRPRVTESTPSTSNVKRRRVDVPTTPLLTNLTAEMKTPLTGNKRRPVHTPSSRKINTTFTKKEDSQKPRWR